MVKNSLKRYMILYLWQICLGDLELWHIRIFHSWKYLMSFFLTLLNYSSINLGLLTQFWRQWDSYLQNWSSPFRRCILTKKEIKNVHLSWHLGLGLGCRFRLPFIYFEIKTFAKGFNDTHIVKNLYFGGQHGIWRPLRCYIKIQTFWHKMRPGHFLGKKPVHLVTTVTDIFLLLNQLNIVKVWFVCLCGNSTFCSSRTHEQWRRVSLE